MRIRVKDLVCYKNASEADQNHRLVSPDRAFDLDQYPEQLQKEMEAFLFWRGENLALKSIRTEFWPYHQVGTFLKAMYPDLKTFIDAPLSEMEYTYKNWLVKNQKSFTRRKIRKETGTVQWSVSEGIAYLRRIYEYYNPIPEKFDFEADRWNIQQIDFPIRNNPVKRVKSISFVKILQEPLKTEIKMVIQVHWVQKALGTIQAELASINRFSNWLSHDYPQIVSLAEIDRDVLESYLLHTNTEAIGRKNYSKELCHLKTIFNTAAGILDLPHLRLLFVPQDIGKVPEKLYKTYSDMEIKRLNRAILERDEQVARVLIVHQMLGTRISETLTLETNCLEHISGEKHIIRIFQVKTQRYYEKPVNKEIVLLLEKAIHYTKDRFGARKYIFVSTTSPDEPMQYSKIQYQLMSMIREQDLRDDHGNLFCVGTHIWRYTYGKKLTELHLDDVTIAKLIGHSGTQSVKYYRRVGKEAMCTETKAARVAMDDMLKEVIEGWDWL